MRRPVVAARRRRLLPPPARKPPTPAVESDRVWKAPGHHPPTARTFPHPLEIPRPHPPTRGFPQLRTAAATRSYIQGRGEETMTDYVAPESGQGGHLD
jgi:hypothetical protein